jgi:hypothetical protein
MPKDSTILVLNAKGMNLCFSLTSTESTFTHALTVKGLKLCWRCSENKAECTNFECSELAWVAACSQTRRYSADGRIKQWNTKTHTKRATDKVKQSLEEKDESK